MPVRRRPATAPADRVAALASSALAAPKVATFRAAMRGSVSRARTAAWDAALKEMRDLGAQYYPEETKSRGFIPELGVEIHKRGGLYYYDRIARGFQDGALTGGVGFGDSGAVARGHMHWTDQFESKGDNNNAEAYSQKAPDYKAWVGSWYGSRLYWHNGKPTEPRMPDWNRYKY
jgi:hypothetical protein